MFAMMGVLYCYFITHLVVFIYYYFVFYVLVEWFGLGVGRTLAIVWFYEFCEFGWCDLCVSVGVMFYGFWKVWFRGVVFGFFGFRVRIVTDRG